MNKTGPLLLVTNVTLALAVPENHTSMFISCEGRPLMWRPYTFSQVGYYSRRYVFPLQFLVGTFTNCVNFRLLTSGELRSRTNSFLAAMAMADLLFFVVYAPMQLSSYDTFARSHAYTVFYFNSNIPLVACANWFSTASIWLAVAVTLERVVAVRYPLHARYYLRKTLVLLAIPAVLITSFLLNIYHCFVRTVELRPVKNSTFCKYVWVITDPQQQPATALYVKVSTYLQTIFSILVPLLLLILFNGVLLHFLHRNRHDLESTDFMGKRRPSVSHQRQEVKVTLTVVTIVLAFLVLNVPSGVVATLELVSAGAHARMPMSFYEITETCNVLVVTGKMINFFLYCFSSSTFRRRLRKAICEEKQQFFGGGHFWFLELAKRRKRLTSLSSSSGATFLSSTTTSRRTSLQPDSRISSLSFKRGSTQQLFATTTPRKLPANPCARVRIMSDGHIEAKRLNSVPLEQKHFQKLAEAESTNANDNQRLNGRNVDFLRFLGRNPRLNQAMRFIHSVD